MGITTKIQWTDKTWNPWLGCIKVSAGCKGCYMYRDMEFYKMNPMDIHPSKTKFNDPMKWCKWLTSNPEKAKKEGVHTGMKIFTCSWSDWFIEQADSVRRTAWDIVEFTPFIYQIPTKRVQNIGQRLPHTQDGTAYVPKNVWLGASIENNKMLDERWFRLLAYKILCPGSIYWFSIEPLLEDISTKLEFNLKHSEAHPDWIVIGGESGNTQGKYKARECRLNWISKIVGLCKKYDIPVFVKQTGSVMARSKGWKDTHGGTMEDWPETIRYREFPQYELNLNKSNK